VRHALRSEALRDYASELAEQELLLGSMTSENGTFGKMRTSLCAVERDNGRFILERDATTGSYCAQADGILVTARRAPDAPGTDQVPVLVKREDCRLVPTGTWDALDMRGTCSPGYRLDSWGPQEQVLPCPFVDIAAQTMVPYSHVLWSSLWWGIAADALSRAALRARDIARRNPGQLPPERGCSCRGLGRAACAATGLAGRSHRAGGARCARRGGPALAQFDRLGA
jgi:acyl-CoA dehydrogenase